MDIHRRSNSLVFFEYGFCGEEAATSTDDKPVVVNRQFPPFFWRSHRCWRI